MTETGIFLGQLQSVDPAILRDVLVILAALAVLFFSARQAFRKAGKMDIEQPIEVKEAMRFVPKEKCDTMHHEMTRRLSFVEQELIRLRGEMKQESQERSTLIRSEIGGVYARLKQTEERLEEQVRCLPNEIVALLRNTGMLK